MPQVLRLKVCTTCPASGEFSDEGHDAPERGLIRRCKHQVLRCREAMRPRLKESNQELPKPKRTRKAKEKAYWACRIAQLRKPGA